MKFLKKNYDKIITEEKEVLNSLLENTSRLDIPGKDRQALEDSVSQLDELFLLVIVGEFNAGKSAIINALLGKGYLKEGVTPTTTKITIIRFDNHEHQEIIDDKQTEIYLPVEWLDDISIVDTPGTNAIIRSHELLTTQFIPRADLVIFVTSADRPFTESERLFLENIKQWGKKIIFVINKIDLLQDEKDFSKVLEFVRQNAFQTLGLNTEIFPVSARLAILGKQGDSNAIQKSAFAELETFIIRKLDEKSRIKFKLLNPIGVGVRLCENYLNSVDDRLSILKGDIRTLNEIDGQLNQFESDLQREFKFRLADIENTLFEMQQRGENFFDETFKLSRVPDLLNKERIQHQFMEQVTQNVADQIDQKVTDLIDWLVSQDLNQWQAINDYLAQKAATHESQILGEAKLGSFQYQRQQILENVGKSVEHVVKGYDRKAEAQSIAEEAQIAVAASAALEIGAVGLGTLIATLATTAAADVTGILLASVLAALGLFVIPARRRSAKKLLRERVEELRSQLLSTLDTHFTQELKKIMGRILDALAPFSRFVRAEQNSLEEIKTNLSDNLKSLQRLKETVENLS